MMQVILKAIPAISMSPLYLDNFIVRLTSIAAAHQLKTLGATATLQTNTRHKAHTISNNIPTTLITHTNNKGIKTPTLLPTTRMLRKGSEDSGPLWQVAPQDTFWDTRRATDSWERLGVPLPVISWVTRSRTINITTAASTAVGEVAGVGSGRE